jgi:hypothetical protein
MSEPVRLTQAQFELLRMIENGVLRSCGRNGDAQALIAAGLIVSVPWGRSRQGVSITHRGREVALGKAPFRGDDE